MITIRKATGSEVTTEQLFKAPTIAGLAAAIRGTNPDVEVAGAIPCADSSEEQRAAGVPCSANQAQMAVLFQMQPQSAAYNMSSAMRLVGRLDARALEASSPPCVPLLSSLCKRISDIAYGQSLFRHVEEVHALQPLHTTHALHA